ncbi:MAG: L,D-transpeptidase family protein [Ilumatobacteraceae bacterium]
MVNKTTLSRNLYSGVFGDDVKALQTRLTQLGFAPGVVDGAFGGQTQQAVWAYEKLVLKVPRADATGKITNDTWQGMQDAVTIAPRRPNPGTHVEIYLPEQVAIVFTDNSPTLIIHISSGEALTNSRDAANTWCQNVKIDTDDSGNAIAEANEKRVCGVSYTPGGVFRFKRKVEGHRVGALGGMDNPIYFNFGIAMHGAQNVPIEPASHGCIRMHKTISDTFQSYVHLRDVVYVWGQDGKEPEQYSKNQTLPVFDWDDPTATTTTTIETTTSTKVAATPTSAKPATTTSTATTTATTTAKTNPPVTTAAPVTVAVTVAPTTAPPATSAPATTP